MVGGGKEVEVVLFVIFVEEVECIKEVVFKKKV